MQRMLFALLTLTVGIFPLSFIGVYPAQAQEISFEQARVVLSKQRRRPSPSPSPPPQCCDNSTCRNRYPNVPSCLQSCVGGTCPIYGRGGTTGPTLIPAELLAQIGIAIAQGRATVGDYNLLAYANAVEGNFSAAETRYREALGLAQQLSDRAGEAVAREGLGNVYLELNRFNEASSELRDARELYRSLGDSARFNQIQLQIRNIPQLRNPLQLREALPQLTR